MKSYRQQYDELLKKCRQKGVRVRLVKVKQTEDFIGMNSEAAKILGRKMPPNTIDIDRKLPLGTKTHTLRHELIEMQAIKQGNLYWPAHKKALRGEKCRG